MGDIPEVLLEIASLLRAAGAPVSLSEVLDAAQGWKSTPPAYWPEVVRVTLVKRYEDLLPLERLLELRFSPGAGAKVLGGNNNAVTVSGQGLKHAGGQLPVQEVLAALFEGTGQALNRLAELALARLGEFKLEFLDHLEEKVKEAMLALNWAMVRHNLQSLEREGKPEALVAWERLELLERIVRKKLETNLVEKFGPQALISILQNYNLAEKSWEELAEKDIASMRPYLKRLGRFLGSRYSWRYLPAKKGKMDLRRTVKEACRWGGTPWRLRYRKKREDRPELVVLCDVSGSVAPFSIFMLEMVYAIQHAFSQVRSFVFVDEIAEVTYEVRKLPAAGAMEQVARFARCSVSGFSDFGRTFKLFLERYGEIITSRTTLLILGDARNNWRPPEVEAFARLCQKARRVIWLNPQPRAMWNTQDSLIGLYAPYCQVVKECANLKQLIEITKILLPSAR
ncbi:MAG: hypothetical protein PWP65_2157 [Clostridia bacterium]|nr:hypothetical protein [Clostridia bacterium]